jgi:hypothetical protein
MCLTIFIMDKIIKAIAKYVRTRKDKEIAWKLEHHSAVGTSIWLLTPKKTIGISK